MPRDHGNTSQGNALPPRRRLRRALALAGFFAVIFSGYLLSLQVRWKRTVAGAEAAQARLDGLTFERPALWGELALGSAFDAYEEALEFLPDELPDGQGGTQADLTKLLFRAQPDGIEGGPVGRLLDSPGTQRALACLRRGAHCADAHPSWSWRTPTEKIPRLVDSRLLVLLAQAHAQRLARRGEDLEAARWVMDAAQFSLDIARTPYSIQRAIGCILMVAAFYGGDHSFGDLGFLGREGRLAWVEALAQVEAGLLGLPDIAEGELAVHMVEATSSGAVVPFSRRALMVSDLHGAIREIQAAMAEDREKGQSLAYGWHRRLEARRSEYAQVPLLLASAGSSTLFTLDRLALLETALALDVGRGRVRAETWKGEPVSRVVTDEYVEVSAPVDQQTMELRVTRTDP